jgi:hypothetical protein
VRLLECRIFSTKRFKAEIISHSSTAWGKYSIKKLGREKLSSLPNFEAHVTNPEAGPDF